MADSPAFVTIPNVELLEVGEDWETSTGVFTWTADDLVAAISAMDDPAVRSPVIKLGHTDPRFDGQPSFGRVVNLRLSENGMTLLGDLSGVPAWLAEAMPSAYPRRSIEGYFHYQTQTGKTHDFAMTALSLLGEQYPAITTLEDIKAVFGADAIEDVEMVAAASGAGEMIRASKVGDDMPRWKREQKVAAAVDVDSVRRAFYEDSEWSEWIRAVQLEPDQLIVEDDDDGKLYRVPFSIKGEEVTFAEAVQVRIEYVDTGKAAASAGQSEQFMAVYASADESRANVSTNGLEDGTVNEKQLETLGLPADASQEDIDARLADLVKLEGTKEDKGGETAPGTETPAPGEPTDPKPGTEAAPTDAPSTTPEGTVLVEAKALEQLKASAARADQLWEKQRVETRDKLIGDAVAAGKFGPASRPAFAKQFDLDPDGTRKTVEAMASGVVPLSETGHAGGSNDTGTIPDDAFPSSWLPQPKVSN